MKGITHSLGGVMAGVALVACSTPDLTTVEGIGTAVSAIGVATLGSLLPDIDHQHSTVSKKFRLLSFLYRIVSVLGKLFRLDVFEHRGVMHTLVVPIILLISSFVVKDATVKYLLIAGLVGYLSHILLDGFNPMGVPLFSPFYNLKIRFLPKKICVRTGSASELLVGSVLILGIFLVGKPIIQMLYTNISYYLT